MLVSPKQYFSSALMKFRGYRINIRIYLDLDKFYFLFVPVATNHCLNYLGGRILAVYNAGFPTKI